MQQTARGGCAIGSPEGRPAGAGEATARLRVLLDLTAALHSAEEPGDVADAMSLVGTFFDGPQALDDDDADLLVAVERLKAQATERLHLRAEVRAARRQVQAAAARAERIGLLGAALASTLSVDDVASVLAEHVQQAVACETFSLRLVLPGEGVARAVRLGGAPIGYQERFGDVRLDLPSAIAEVAATRAPVFLRSAEENGRLFGEEATVNYEAARIAGLARLPLMVERDLVGILSVGYWNAQEFAPEERLFLTTVADLAAQALGRAMRTERLRHLLDLSDLALSRHSLGELVPALGQRLAAMLDGAEVTLYLYDPARPALLPGPAAAGRPLPIGRGLLSDAVHSKAAVVVPDVAAASPDAVDARWRGFGSLALVPLVSDGRVTGMLVVGRTFPGAFPAADLELIDLASARFAVALDRSQAFETQRTLARTLQATLLPPALPAIPGLELAARYEAAGAATDVGGDFYDVFALPDGAWLAVIGDVRGRGPSAAAVTGLIRNTVRAVAADEGRPAVILQRLNAVLHVKVEPEDFATIACVRIVPRVGGVELAVASAGHCHPLIVRGGAGADGDVVEVVEMAGTILGAFEHVTLEERRVVLDVGDVLVLHTDGVTEAARAQSRFGEERLAECLRPTSGLSAEQVVGAVYAGVSAYADGSSEDDMAILGIKVVKADHLVGVLLDRRLPHTLRAPAAARRLLDHLVAALGTAELGEHVRIAVSEMVTNAVTHAPTEDDIVLRVLRKPACVRVEVHNTGPAFTVPTGEPDQLSEGGRGLMIVSRLASRTGLEFDGTRTQVWCEFDL